MNDLIHINEALSGLPVNVDFISFDDVKKNKLSKYQVIINAGAAGTAWSGGDNWKDPSIEEVLSKWVYDGGTFIGVNEPSAVEGYDNCFRMANILGVDKNIVSKVCHGKWSFETTSVAGLIPEGAYIPKRCSVRLTDGKAQVLLEKDGEPVFTVNNFGKGLGIYLSTFETTTVNNRLLLNILMYAAKQPLDQNNITDNANTECAYFPADHKLIVINNSDNIQSTSVKTAKGTITFNDIAPFDTVIKQL
jgi:beta-D-galactosyl-(1->4)-L-rhamnose phosphorylase